jgi:hypothetical protein
MPELIDLVRGCTFDDFLLTPQYSVVERRDPAAIDLSSRLTEHLTLKRPIVSANMDTITRAEMAIAVTGPARARCSVKRPPGWTASTGSSCTEVMCKRGC